MYNLLERYMEGGEEPGRGKEDKIAMEILGGAANKAHKLFSTEDESEGTWGWCFSRLMKELATVEGKKRLHMPSHIPA